MKHISFLLIVVLFVSNICFSQQDQNQMSQQAESQAMGMLMGGLGMTWIDGKPYYTFRFMPEVSFLNFGVGLDLNLNIDTKGKIRKENFNETSDYLSLIRYVRYGQKKDNVYVRVGALDYSFLGHGTIMYMYNNSPSFDARKIGLELDLDFNQLGFESVYGTFGEAGLIGFRGYVRPLKFTELGELPVIGGFEVGATYAKDLNKYSGAIQGTYNPQTQEFDLTKDKGPLSIVGFDLGLPVLRIPTLDVDLYYDYIKILEFGDGMATGALFTFNFMGLVKASAKLERRFNNDRYLPAYFNSFYEIERFRAVYVDDTTAYFISKAARLDTLKNNNNGIYGELLVDIVGLFKILGSYQKLDKQPRSGILHLSSDISPKDASFVARVGYDKRDVRDLKDLFTLNERSYLFTEFGYKPYPFLLVSAVIHHTFVPAKRDKNDRVIAYKTQKRIEPRVSFMMPLNF